MSDYYESNENKYVESHISLGYVLMCMRMDWMEIWKSDGCLGGGLGVFSYDSHGELILKFCYFDKIYSKFIVL